MNKIYKKMYKERIFKLKEANKIIKNIQVCKNNLTRLLAKHLIKRIRKSIYYIVPLDNEDFYPDPIHLGTKIRDEAPFMCDTALLIHGVIDAKSALHTIYIGYSQASKIRIRDVTYNILKNDYDIGIETVEYATPYGTINVEVTDIERTIIDCIRTKSIKMMDIISLVGSMKSINIKKILNYLEKIKKPILYNKIGLILETNQKKLNIEINDLEKIKKKLSKKTYYAKEKELTLIKPKYKYYKQWNIMIPEKIHEMFKEKNNAQNNIQ